MFLFFSVARSQEIGSWERATEVAQENASIKTKAGKAAAANASFGMNMPLMSSAFDTAMWLDAA
jgi:IMP dehydrogenase/GMP reductase